MGKGGNRPNSVRKKSGGMCSQDDSLGPVAERARQRMARLRQQETPPRPWDDRFPSLGPEAKRAAMGRPPSDPTGPMTGIDRVNYKTENAWENREMRREEEERERVSALRRAAVSQRQDRREVLVAGHPAGS